MKTSTILAVAALSLVFASPSFAQHGGNRGGNNRGGGRHEDPRIHEGHQRQHESERGHFDGRHFDRDYHERYFGRAHYFGPNFEVIGGGYRFFYGGFYFGFYEPIPFSTECYYIDLGPDGFYYLYAPVYPGWRVRLEVIVD